MRCYIGRRSKPTSDKSRLMSTIDVTGSPRSSTSVSMTTDTWSSAVSTSTVRTRSSTTSTTLSTTNTSDGVTCVSLTDTNMSLRCSSWWWWWGSMMCFDGPFFWWSKPSDLHAQRNRSHILHYGIGNEEFEPRRFYVYMTISFHLLIRNHQTLYGW